MSSQKERLRGRLFENRDKRKPSQPDMQGDGRIAGKSYAIAAWEREEQLVLSLAPPRDKTNTYPPEAFRGALNPASRGRPGADTDSVPVWIGEIEGEGGRYAVRAFQQQGKSGPYLSLELERVEVLVEMTDEAPTDEAPTDEAPTDEAPTDVS